MDNTPLGRVVSVRGEDDPKIISQMSPWQRKIRSDWQVFISSRTIQQPQEDIAEQMASLERMLAKMFGGG